jgi:hypothetical protein
MSVTGRDGRIIQQALAYFIAVQDAMPRELQERSNMLDAVALLDPEGDGAMHFAQARRQLGVLRGEPIAAPTGESFASQLAAAGARLAELRAEYYQPTK